MHPNRTPAGSQVLPLLRWLAESYTVVILYVLIAGLGWHYDVRMGMALFVLLPIAFVLGRGSVLDDQEATHRPAPERTR